MRFQQERPLPNSGPGLATDRPAVSVSQSSRNQSGSMSCVADRGELADKVSSHRFGNADDRNLGCQLREAPVSLIARYVPVAASAIAFSGSVQVTTSNGSPIPPVELIAPGGGER